MLLRHEPLPPERLIGFVLVWMALIVFTAGSLVERRRAAAKLALLEPPDLTAAS